MPADGNIRDIASRNGGETSARTEVEPLARTLLDEDGKTIRYEHAGRSWSGTAGIASVVLNGDDGEVQFVGLSEMRAARDALILACSMAEVAS